MRERLCTPWRCYRVQTQGHYLIGLRIVFELQPEASMPDVKKPGSMVFEMHSKQSRRFLNRRLRSNFPLRAELTGVALIWRGIIYGGTDITVTGIKYALPFDST